MKKLFLTIIFTTAALISTAVAQGFDYDKIAKHPRILLHKGDVTAMKLFAVESSNARMTHEKIISVADDMLSTNPIKQELLQDTSCITSHEALKRIFYLSYAFVTTEDMNYARRAEREMLAISGFADWSSPHFYATAQTILALAIGYDWLYNVLPVHSRSIIGTAIYEKGLRATEKEENINIFEPTNPHSTLCNTAIIYGALATLERSPEYCKQLITKVLAANDKCLAMYGSEDYTPSDFDSWECSLTLGVMLAATLQSALDDDGNIGDNKAFMRSAHLLNFMTAPSWLSAEYAHSSVAAEAMPAKYWFAKELGDASLVKCDEQIIAKRGLRTHSLLPLYMIFGSRLPLDQQAAPSEKYFISEGSMPLFVYRAGWESPTDSYFAINGGRAIAPCSNIGGGSFIYEWSGVRWIEGCTTHINRKPLDATATASLTHSSTSAADKGVVINMAALCNGEVRKATRSAKLDKRDYLTIIDHISTLDKETTIEWQFATHAEAEIVGPAAIALRLNGEEIFVKLRSKGRTDAKIWPKDDTEPNEVGCVGFVVEIKPNQAMDIEITLSPSRNNLLTRLRDKLSDTTTTKKSSANR